MTYVAAGTVLFAALVVLSGLAGLAGEMQRDSIRLYDAKLIAQGIADRAELDEIGQRCTVEVEDAVAFAEASPWPEPATVTIGVYAP